MIKPRFSFERLTYLDGIISKATAGPWVYIEAQRRENDLLFNTMGQMVGSIGKDMPIFNKDYLMLMNPALAKQMLTEIRVLYHALYALQAHYERLCGGTRQV